MKPYFSEKGIEIYLGDCREVLTAPEFIQMFDSVFTDPPYGLSFMGKSWDHGVPGFPFWEDIKNACKPGAMLMAFGGTRTYHRLTCAIEDAGWEIRDCLMWLYGSGFPKSLDISKAIDKANGDWRGRANGVSSDNGAMSGPNYERTDKGEPISELAKQWSGWGTALKPAWEPIILAMKPLDGTFAENAEKHGVAGLNIDGTRISVNDNDPNHRSIANKTTLGNTFGSKEKIVSVNVGESQIGSLGRWPSNLLLDEESAKMLDEQSGELYTGGGDRSGDQSSWSGELKATAYARVFESNSGGASRFFYVAKASNDGRGNQEELEMPLFNTTDPGLKNIHPTVKPIDLMEKLILLETYLLKLLSTPTGGLILDPFMGSGTTLIAAKRLGRKAIGIEKEEKYAEIAAKRLQNTPLNALESVSSPD